MFVEIPEPNPVIYDTPHSAIRLNRVVKKDDTVDSLFEVEVFFEDGSSKTIETTFKSSNLKTLKKNKSPFFRLTLNLTRWSVTWLDQK